MSPLVSPVVLQVAAEPTAAAASLDPLQLVLDASPVVKGVMILLALMALFCWYIIAAKAWQLGVATRTSRRFLDLFWQGGGGGWDVERIEAVYGQRRDFAGAPLCAVFEAGYVELARMHQDGRGGGRAPLDLGNVERALRKAANAETTALESLLPFLATTAATAPFIGLFGTVWGIMNSFLAIGAQQNASLDVVAPGIAEALIATAIGLFAAIPAVMAYNYFVRRLRILESEMQAFSTDWLNVVRRYFLTD